MTNFDYDAILIGTGPGGEGSIPVNEFMQTKIPNIYAVGDIVGFPNLASASYDQGRYAATHIISKDATQRHAIEKHAH